MRKRRFALGECEAFATREEAEAEAARYPHLHEGREIAELPEGPRVVLLADMDTGGAYDASQCWDSIADGDVLVVPDERVVGILLKAWPTAVTVASGHFHTFSPGFGWDDEAGYGPSVELARAEAKSRGWK